MDWERELIADVFYHLPVKCLLRFRCLSRWHMSIIDDPRFIETYDTLVSFDDTRCQRLFLQFDHPPASDDQVRLCAFSHQAYPSHPVQDRSIVVTGSCSGILCVAFSPFGVSLWNPSTRTHRHISLPMYEHRGRRCRRVSFGLGRDGDGNMKLARLVFSFLPATRMFLCEAQVYSVRTDTWERINFPMILAENCFGDELENGQEFVNSGVSVTYKINWLVKHNPNQNGVGQFEILSLDLNNDSFGTEFLPEFVMEGRSSISLQDINLLPFRAADCLVLHFGGESCEAVIWVKEMAIWTKLLGVKGSFGRLKPLFYSLDKKKVLLQMDSKMVWYDLETGNYWDSNALADGSLLYDATVFRDNCALIDGLGECPTP